MIYISLHFWLNILVSLNLQKKRSPLYYSQTAKFLQPKKQRNTNNKKWQIFPNCYHHYVVVIVIIIVVVVIVLLLLFRSCPMVYISKWRKSKTNTWAGGYYYNYNYYYFLYSNNNNNNNRVLGKQAATAQLIKNKSGANVQVTRPTTTTATTTTTIVLTGLPQCVALAAQMVQVCFCCCC